MILVDIQNMPQNARSYIVARTCEGSCWYYGSWDNKSKADEVAKEIGGIVITEEIQNMPENARSYIVARACEGSSWYYGSWDSKPKADEVAKEIDGYVVAGVC